MADSDLAPARRLRTGLALLALGAGAVYASLALTLTEEGRSQPAREPMAFQRALEAPGAFTASWAGVEAGAAVGGVLGRAVFGDRRPRPRLPEGAKLTEEGFPNLTIPFDIQRAPASPLPRNRLPPEPDPSGRNKLLSDLKEPVPAATEESRREAVKHWNAGIIRYQKGDFQEARDEWLLCRRHDSGNAECLSGLQRIDSSFGVGP